MLERLREIFKIRQTNNKRRLIVTESRPIQATLAESERLQNTLPPRLQNESWAAKVSVSQVWEPIAQLEAGELSPTSAKYQFNPEQTIGRILQEYPENIPIAYRSPKFLRTLGISRQLLNDILTIAQSSDVIPIVFYERGRGRHRTWFLHFRDEIINALGYFSQFRRYRQPVDVAAKRIRSELRTQNKMPLEEKIEKNVRLTISEAAEALGIKPAQLQHLILEGKINLGKEILAENVRRVMRPRASKVRLIPARIIKQPQIEKIVSEFVSWTPSLKDLTLTTYKNHRKFFLTVYEVAKLANLHLRNQELKVLANVLVEAGIEVVELWEKPDHRALIRILLKAEEEKAAEIAKSHPALEKFKPDPVEQIFGPDFLTHPTLWQLNHHWGFLPVSPLFLRYGVKLGGRGRTVERFIARDCPVSIFRARSKRRGNRSVNYRYFFPESQQQDFELYLHERVSKILQSGF